MEAIPQTPSNSEHSDSDIKQMYADNIISSPESAYTLEFKRQTPIQTRQIYTVKFDPEENRFVALGKN